MSVDWPALLSRWAKDYELTKSNELRTFLEPRGLSALWPKLERLPRYAATGGAAGPGIAATRIACRVGQIVATEAERLAVEAITRPLAEWPEDARERIREYGGAWDGLWPINRRRVLAVVFASMSWHVRPQRLEFVLNDPIPRGYLFDDLA